MWTSYKAILANDLTSDCNIKLFCLTETCVMKNPLILIILILIITLHEAPILNYNSLNSFALSVLHQTWKTLQPGL